MIGSYIIHRVAGCIGAGAALTCIGSTFASAQKPMVFRPDSSPPSRVVINGKVDVPMLEERPGDSRPSVEVTINGRGPYRLRIETGARFTAVSPEVAKALGLRRVGGPGPMPEFRVDSMNIGGASFQGISVYALPGVGSGDGLLGLPFYQNVLLTLDYPGHRVSFTGDTLPAQNGRDVLGLTRLGDFWGVPITIAGRASNGVLDTQSSLGLNLSPAAADSLSFDGGLRVLGQARTALGAIDVRGGTLAGDVTIGSYRFPRPFVQVVPLPPPLPGRPNVGTKILDHFVVSLDQRVGRLRLRKEGSEDIVLTGPPGRPAESPGPGTPVPSDDPLRVYVGTFGDRTISLQNRTLYIQRPGGTPLELVNTAPDKFTLKEIPQAKLEFERDGSGRVSALRVLNREGKWERGARAP